MEVPREGAPPDWARDYDVLDPTFVRDPYEILHDLREQCPVAHTERWGGSYMPLGFDDVQAVASDFDHFSSFDMYVIPPTPQEVELSPIPITFIQLDPPEHGLLRRMVLPSFSPQTVRQWEPPTRQLCLDLLAATAGHDVVDAVADYAEVIPPRVVAWLFGLGPDEAAHFARWVIDARELEDPLLRAENAQRVQGLVRSLVHERRLQPGTDFISAMLTQTIDGEPVSDEVVIATSLMMLSAGIRTVISAIGIALWHLGSTPSDRRLLATQPRLIPTAVEELLRAYSPVTMARIVRKQTMVGGVELVPGDRVLLNFAAANRDPAEFEEPDEVRLGRTHNKHIAFGAGVHRCAGSNLARMQLRVAIEEWLARYPEFELHDPDLVTWVGGQVRGPRFLPLRVGARSGSDTSS